MENAMRVVSTNSRFLSSSWALQSPTHPASENSAVHLAGGTRKLNPKWKACLKCTALQQQEGLPPPVSRNPRKQGPTEKLQRKETKPKLHRGWHPGQRTPSPMHGDAATAKSRTIPDETVSAQNYRKPENDQRSPSQRREFLFDAEDDHEFLSDDEDEESDNDDEDWEAEAEEDLFVAEKATPSEEDVDGSGTDLNCKHFTRCSGCVIDKALDRPPVLEDATDFFVKRGVPKFSLTSASLWEWRCRAKLAVRGSSQDPQIGLFEEGTHSIVDIPSCRTHHPSINDAVKLVKQAIRELGIQPYDEDRHTGELRYIQMVVTTFNTSLPAAERYASGKVQITLVWNARDEDSIQADKLHKMAEMLWRRGNPKTVTPVLHSVWANFQTSRTNVIFGGRWRHLMGEPELWERVGGVDIAFTPASFGQANTEAFEALLRKLQKAVKIGCKVVELYAGVGTIGLSLAAVRKCRAVKCVEVNKEGRAVFERSLARLPASVNSDISWHCADVSVSPINWLEGSDVVVVDPPRKGLDQPIIEALRTASLRGLGKSKAPSPKTTEKVEKRPWILRAKQGGVHKEGSSDWEEEEGTWPGTLIYVSCGWQAFKLDYAALVEGNAWHLDSAHAFNFFPGTNSIEVLAVFKRGKKPPPKPAKKGSGVRSKSAKSLKFTRAGKKLAEARKQENARR